MLPLLKDIRDRIKLLKNQRRKKKEDDRDHGKEKNAQPPITTKPDHIPPQISSSVENMANGIRQLGGKVEDITTKWIHTYVINTKTTGNDTSEWHFRTLFVAEITILPFFLAFAVITFWLLNRNTHIRKTKGSTVERRGVSGKLVDGDIDDDEESSSRSDQRNQENNNNQLTGSAIKSSRKEKRQSIHAKLEEIDVEKDDDDVVDDGTTMSMDVSLDALEDSDYEDDNESNSSTDSVSQVFLSKEKLNLWKIIKEIPMFSYFNEEALQICMDYVEYVDLKHAKASLWDKDKFDGSLYYIMNGSVSVQFHDFKATPIESQGYSDEKQHAQSQQEPLSIKHETGTVVTSSLAHMEGMVQSYLQGKSPLSRFMGRAMSSTSAHALEESTRLIRVPPACFSRILERFPETILRIVQTALNRTQRVTVQILVRTLGLRQQLLIPPSTELQTTLLPEKRHAWNYVQDYLAKASHKAKVDVETLPENDKKKLIVNACTVFAGVIGIHDRATIEVLVEYSSFVVLDSSEDSKNRVLLEAGSAHDACYLLLQGDMELGFQVPIDSGIPYRQLMKDPSSWRFERVELLPPGSLLGESACFTTDVNLFEIRCVKSCEYLPVVLLRVPKDIFSHIIVKHPLAMTISLVAMLSVLSPVVHLITWTSEWMHVEAAEDIVHKGTMCDSLFVVLNGRLRAQQTSKARQRALGASSNVVPPEEFGRGKIIGEVQALAGSKWPFDVFAIRQSELAKVPIFILEAVVHNYPSAGLFLARSVASHVESMHYSKRRLAQNPLKYDTSEKQVDMDWELRKTSPPLANTKPNTLPSYGLSLATVAVVPLTYNVDVNRFCTTFVKAMKTIAPSKLLTKSFVKQEIGEKAWSNRSPLNDLKMTRLLADMEENNRVVVYQADPKYTFWTRLCIRQADCILLLVDSDHAPESTRVEQTLGWAYEAMDVRIDLVVVGEGEAKKEEEGDSQFDEASYYDDDDMSVSDQLNNWSEQRKWIAGHHLVRVPFERYRMDFRRMCRRITGRAVGLVLGGGGARGLAHVGIIRALQEAGVVVDMVGGTSQGAFCGALFARYPDDYNQVHNACKEMAAELSSVKAKILDLTLPITSTFSGRSFNRGIRRLLGKLRIQDLVLNFFCISVDLLKQTEVVHTKGLLWKYVRASMTMAGYLPPIAENGSLLVDGGYLNTVPADVMRFKMGARTVISVDVSPENERDYFEYGTHLSGWWLLWNSWNPFVKTVKVPSMGDISEMLIWVSSEQHRKTIKAVSDLHFMPPIYDVGFLEYDRCDEIIERSYEYAKPMVEEFVKQNPWIVYRRKAADR